MNQLQEHFDVVVIGTGFSGLLCTTYLKEAGIDDICVFEKNASVGGVWSNGGVGAYPGAACDVQSYTYLPFLDRTGFIPSKKYVNQHEIAEYAETLTDRCSIRDKIRFSRKVTQLDYIGDDKKVWRICTVDPNTNLATEVVTAQHVVTANGPLSSPRMPEVPGMERFKGESFHTAEWKSNAKLTDKRVGIIGTGASAAQVITSIVNDVGELIVFQRTPTWAIPRDDQPTPADMIVKFKAGDYGEELRDLYWKREQWPDDVPFSFDDLQDEQRNAEICAALAEGIKQQVHDPALAAKLTPDYPFFCKRPLVIDDYYTTFNNPKVTLVDDPGGVVAINETGVEIARGETFDLDVIIYATGFDNMLIPFPVRGRNGVTLADKFGANESNHFQMTRPQSLWGIHVEDMPNFYMMIGPQSLNPVTNVTVLSEEQSNYLATLIRQMQDRNQLAVEPTHQAVEQWTTLCNQSSEGKVWRRCNNWYMKTTKTDVAAGRERAASLWLRSYTDYIKYFIGHEGGTPEQLLRFE